MRFVEYLAEIFGNQKRVLTNPSKAELAAHHKRSEQKELRYIHNTKTNTTHVGDSHYFDHHDLADSAGESEFNNLHKHRKEHEGGAIAYSQGHYHAGIVDDGNLEQIRKHPKGLNGYIHDLHSDW